MARTGRPTKLTPELQADLLRYLRAGNYVVTACKATGIDETQFYKWMEKGAKCKAGIHVDFYQSVQKALADGEALMVGAVRIQAVEHDAAPDGRVPGNWLAAMTDLERRYPERWGRRVVDNRLTGADGKGPVQIEVGVYAHLSDKELAETLAGGDEDGGGSGDSEPEGDTA